LIRNHKQIELPVVVRGLKLTPPACVSTSLAEKIAEHNRQADSVLESVASGDELVAAAVDGAADAESSGTLAGAIETRRFLTLEAAQAAVVLWRQRGELAQAVAEEVRPKVEPARKAHDDAVEATRASLAKIGISEDTMLAGGWNQTGARNPTAAGHQLRHIVNQALPVRQAAATLQDATNATNAAVQQIAASDAGFTQAQQAVRGLAEKAAAQVA